MEIFCLPELLETGVSFDLLEHLKALPEDIVLDGSEVKRLGGRCLEILLSARKTALARNRKFIIQNPSPELEKSLVLLGARRLLDGDKT
ncbi:chemotaxis protein CheX [Gluconobacter oxydans]|jgi:chemotaxis protein CheX|uniref:STAS domain-containing protein n=1 Tax=Gluconobacter thailandicus TaxID=257438 RepID=A0AAP9ERC7_GLUTH|nr:STAS domain-containing protein [Gluconobacter thailandicus]AFW00097.1 chemotaxis protein CheX [Gluconobacter oxydans H24]ANQ41109.1 chemotaxis protein CheX [Gluconobacter oxydans]KXV32442.1 chemotaxis protein CheX [Gluconobacter thailandicus]QEH96246.1 STAS domain-containing protein [Gluconobacter thailandicus]